MGDISISCPEHVVAGAESNAYPAGSDDVGHGAGGAAWTSMAVLVWRVPFVHGPDEKLLHIIFRPG